MMGDDGTGQLATGTETSDNTQRLLGGAPARPGGAPSPTDTLVCASCGFRVCECKTTAGVTMREWTGSTEDADELEMELYLASFAKLLPPDVEMRESQRMSFRAGWLARGMADRAAGAPPSPAGPSAPSEADWLAVALYTEYVRGSGMTPKWAEQMESTKEYWRERAALARAGAPPADTTPTDAHKWVEAGASTLESLAKMLEARGETESAYHAANLSVKLTEVAAALAGGAPPAAPTRPADAPPERTMFWDVHNPEDGQEDLDELAHGQDWQPGHVYRVQRAAIRPDGWAAVWVDPKDQDCVITRCFDSEAEARAALRPPQEERQPHE